MTSLEWLVSAGCVTVAVVTQLRAAGRVRALAPRGHGLSGLGHLHGHCRGTVCGDSPMARVVGEFVRREDGWRLARCSVFPGEPRVPAQPAAQCSLCFRPRVAQPLSVAQASRPPWPWQGWGEHSRMLAGGRVQRCAPGRPLRCVTSWAGSMLPCCPESGWPLPSGPPSGWWPTGFLTTQCTCHKQLRRRGPSRRSGARVPGALLPAGHCCPRIVHPAPGAAAPNVIRAGEAGPESSPDSHAGARLGIAASC